jgi:hypothetical protein
LKYYDRSYNFVCRESWVVNWLRQGLAVGGEFYKRRPRRRKPN